MDFFYALDTGFFKKGKYLWCTKVISGMFKKLEDFKEYNVDEAKEECLEIFLRDMHTAQDNFYKKIKELPLKMKCRTMCDDKSHFGGQECAEYMRDIRRLCETYLKNSSFSDDLSEGSIANVISMIKEKAREDESIAWKIEKKNKETYDVSGEDDSLVILKESGYIV